MANSIAPGGSNSGFGSDDRANRDQMVNHLRESSQQDRRVYVGNLSYDVKWHHLKDFMRQAGEVLFADVLLLPNGMSKGCGIVEYATREQAQQAVATLSNQNLMGRLVYVREDREAEPKFIGSTTANRGSGFAPGGSQQQGSSHGALNGGRQLYVANLPFHVGWQDMKDLFRQAALSGGVIRADVHLGPDGRPKGSGIVVFETSDDARTAIQRFNGYEWQGRQIEVREDRFANSGSTGYGGGPSRGAYGGGPRGGGFSSPYGGRAGFSGARGGTSFGGGRGGHGNVAGGANFELGTSSLAPNAFTDLATAGTEQSDIIFVRNLPWSTSNDDLVDLFVTIGKVEQAEIQYEPSGRSRGTGVVRFDSAETADTAIIKFQGYQYGGRPISLSYVKYLTPGADEDNIENDTPEGLTQDQMM